MNNNLIFVQWTNNFGGLEKVTADYEKIFSSYNPIVAPLKSKEDGIHYKNHFKFKSKSRLSLLWQYFNFVSQNRNAVFHLQYPGSRILLLTYLAGARKIIFHFHGTKFSSNRFDKFVWGMLKNKITIIANSNHTKEVISARLGISENVKIIPNYINSAYFSFSEKKSTSGKFIITYAGRFTKGKNLDAIIETARCLFEKYRNIEIRLYGDGPEKASIEELINSYELKGKVLLPGFTNNLHSVYKNSHLFLFLSSYESFGNVVAEAVLSGTPVLCNSIPSLNELINDDLFFVNNLIPEDIADKILFMKNNYELINIRLKTVYSRLVKYLDNCAITDNLQSIYNNFN